MIAATLPFLPSLPAALASGAQAAAGPAAPHTQWSAGRIDFENLNYLISTGGDSSVRVLNKNSNEQYLAWGPPQLWVDGAQAFSFCGNTSLALHDGTLLTLTTQPLADDPLVTAIHKVTITQGDYGVEILGLDSAGGQALRFVQTQRYGGLLHAAVGDGNLVFENPNGVGFIGDNRPGAHSQPVWSTVDQAYIDATDLARLGALAGTRGAAFLSLHSLWAITFGGIFQGPMAYRYSDWVETPLNPNDEPLWRVRVPRDGAAVWQVATRPRGCAPGF